MTGWGSGRMQSSRSLPSGTYMAGATGRRRGGSIVGGRRTMDRLTNSGTKEAKSSVTIREVLNKLAEYEDLVEQGKLLKLPCKMGDITYWISDEDEDGNKIPTIRENSPVIGIAVQEDGFYILCDGDNEYQKAAERWCFLTREEAEAALKEL